MKSIFKLFAVAGALLLCAAAAFSQDADAYGDEPIAEVQEQKAQAAGDSYEETDKKLDAAAEKAKKKREKQFGSSGNFFKDFIFGKKKYIEYDEVDLAVGTLTFGVKPEQAQMLYNPKTDKAGIRVHFQTSYYNIVFGEKERKQIIHSISQYLEDFENKRLITKKAAKTRKIYGNGKCFVEWGTTRAMMTNYCNTKIQYGYEFKKASIKDEKSSPYFCLIIKGAKNEQKEMGSYISQECTEIQVYFTRAKAKAFAYQISEEKIDEQRLAYHNYLEADAYEKVNNVDNYSEGDGYSVKEPEAPAAQKTGIRNLATENAAEAETPAAEAPAAVQETGVGIQGTEVSAEEEPAPAINAGDNAK